MDSGAKAQVCRELGWARFAPSGLPEEGCGPVPGLRPSLNSKVEGRINTQFEGAISHGESRAQSQPAAGDLDTFKLGDAVVAAKVPANNAPEPASQEDYNGWTYTRSFSGELGRQLGKGGGDEIAKLYAARAATPVAEWRTKIVLFDDVDVMGAGADGVLRSRRSGYFGPDLHGAEGAIALFGSMVEAYSGGKLKFVPDFQIESESMRFELPGESPFSEAFVKSYFGPRVNGGTYQAEDNVYRGPYNSILFLHFGLTGASIQTQVNGMPVTGLPYYYSFDRERPELLAYRLFNAWMGQVLFNANRHGYELGSLALQNAGPGETSVRLRLPQGLITDTMWPIIANLKDTNDFAAHVPKTDFGSGPSTFTPVLWSKVSSDPWSQIPKIDTERLKAETGATAEDLQAIESERPQVSLLHNGKSFVLCEPEFADYLPWVSADTHCLGYVTTKFGPKVVLQVAPTAVSMRPGIKTAPVAPTQISFKSGDPGLPFGGYCAAKIVDDPDLGKALLVEDDWVVRNGWVQLYKNEASDTSKYRFLHLMVKPVAFNHAITVVGKDGTKTNELFGSESPAPEDPNETETTLGLPADGSWHRVVIDLGGVGKLQAIYLTAGNARWWQVSLDRKASILLGDYELLADGSPTAAAPQQAADDPESRAKFLAGITSANYDANKAQVLADLKGPDRLTELNAANVYTRVKDKAAFDLLGDLTQNLDPRIAEVSMKALMSQGTDVARGPVLLALTNGPFDSNRYWAAKALAGQKDPYLAENYSRLIASKSWETRLVAAEGLAAMPGDKPKGFFMGFLLDVNPEIETTIARLGDPGDDLFEKRMQWYAVNDSSDEMRFLSNVALLRSTLPDYPGEGIKGLHDDSWWVRRELLNYLAAHKDPKWHDQIVAALQDSNEEVKAAAIRALSVLGPSENLNAISNVRDDKDPRVQKALAEFSKGHAG